MIEKQQYLKRRKAFALSILVFATLVFAYTLTQPTTFWFRLLKAGAEAAMVGGLADWFAVVALFRHPLGIPFWRTAVIPRNKERIADSLADFVQDKFLQPEVLAQLIRRNDPAQRFTNWLRAPDNVRTLGGHSTAVFSAWLDLVDDRHIQAFMGDALRTAVGKVNLSHALGSVLQMLSQGGRHQRVLDSVIDRIVDLVRNPSVREQIAQRVVDWLKEEHKIKQLILPTEWLGEKAAEAAGTGVERFLREVAENPKHELRAAFDEELKKLVQRLQQDDDFYKKSEEIKSYILNGTELRNHGRDIWVSLRDWIAEDLASENPKIQQQIESMIQWLAVKLDEDEDLRESLNRHMESIAYDAAPHFAEFLTRHIRDTVRQWDVKELTQQIELNIGPDLQYIRVNGTVVGLFIGVVLFVVSNPAETVEHVGLFIEGRLEWLRSL